MLKCKKTPATSSNKCSSKSTRAGCTAQRAQDHKMLAAGFAGQPSFEQPSSVPENASIGLQNLEPARKDSPRPKHVLLLVAHYNAQSKDTIT